MEDPFNKRIIISSIVPAIQHGRQGLCRLNLTGMVANHPITSETQRRAHVRCKTNNNIILFYPFVQDANGSFVPCFAFVLCIMTTAMPFYMDHKPREMARF